MVALCTSLHPKIPPLPMREGATTLITPAALTGCRREAEDRDRDRARRDERERDRDRDRGRGRWVPRVSTALMLLLGTF